MINFHFSIFSLILVSIEKIYQTLETVLHHSTKHLEVCQNTPLRVIFSTLGVWKCGQTGSFVFDILLLLKISLNSLLPKSDL